MEKKDYSVEAKKGYKKTIGFILKRRDCPQVCFLFETREKKLRREISLEYEVFDEKLSVSFFDELGSRREIALIPLEFVSKVIEAHNQLLKGYLKDYLPVLFNQKDQEPYVFNLEFKSIDRPVSLSVNISNGRAHKGLDYSPEPLLSNALYNKKEGQILSAWIFTKKLKKHYRTPSFSSILKDITKGIEEGLKQAIESPAFSSKRKKLKEEADKSPKPKKAFVFALSQRKSIMGAFHKEILKMVITEEGECVQNIFSFNGDSDLRTCKEYLIKKMQKFYYHFDLIVPRYNEGDFAEAYQKFIRNNRFSFPAFIPLTRQVK